jgi:ATP-dependent DNA helicase RecG
LWSGFERAVVPISVSIITADQAAKILEKSEGHFGDFKSKAIKPARLTKTLSAFANADGGELYVGIDEQGDSFHWNGFAKAEDANGHVQALEELFPLGSSFRYSFLECKGRTGLVLFCEIEKTPDIRNASDGIAYLRRGAQNLPQDTAEKIERLKYSKGIISFEDQKLNTNYAQISNSLAIIEFALEIIPTAEPDIWLKKQHLIVDDRPTVAGAVLFSDEPQVNLPKAAIKVYRYKTRDAVGTRDTLAFNPLSIEGNAYKQIYETVALIKKITEEIPLVTLTGLEKIEYPTEAIHEVVTNAVIHRDYSINDDIHVRIFDNRIEVASPGTLPAHVTVANILDERFARNPKIVRILNKFRNPPNKDVGEGLNTAFEAMRKLKLKDPLIEQRENSVVVALRHEQLGTPEQIIVDYLRANDEVNNAIARGICFIGSENSMKRIFQKMITSGLIKRVPNRPLNKTGYVKGRNFPK